MCGRRAEGGRPDSRVRGRACAGREAGPTGWLRRGRPGSGASLPARRCARCRGSRAWSGNDYVITRSRTRGAPAAASRLQRERGRGLRAAEGWRARGAPAAVQPDRRAGLERAHRRLSEPGPKRARPRFLPEGRRDGEGGRLKVLEIQTVNCWAERKGSYVVLTAGWGLVRGSEMHAAGNSVCAPA